MNASTSSFTPWLKQNIFRLIFFILTFLLASTYTIETLSFLIDTYSYMGFKIIPLIYSIVYICILYAPPIISIFRMLPKNQEAYFAYTAWEVVLKLFICFILCLTYIIISTFFFGWIYFSF